MTVLRKPILYILFIWSTVAIAQTDTSWQKDTLQSYVDKSNIAYDNYQYKDAIKYASLLIEKGKEYELGYYEFLGYDILGGIYIETDDSIQGKIYSEKALSIARTLKADSLVAWGALNLGILYSENENTYDKAIEHFEESISINKKLEDHNEVYLTYINLIWTLLDNDQPKKAYEVLKKARTLPNIEIDTLNKVYLDMLHGRYLLTQKNFSAAQAKLEKIAAIADKENNTDLALEAYEYLAELHSATYNYKDAFTNLDKFHEYKQKAYTLKKLEESEKARVKFELEQAQENLQSALKEQAYTEELISKSKSLTTTLIALVVFLILSLIGIYFFFRTRKLYISNLQAKNKELIQAREDAEKLSKVKTKFLSTVSHELRTPLYGVIGISTLLKEDERLKDFTEDLDALKFSADYLLALINDVLLLSKMDAAGVKLSRIPYEMDTLLKNITKSFDSRLKENNNQLHLEIDSSLPNNFIGDPVRLSQVLINLIGNAIKFTENGNIWLKLKPLEKEEDSTIKIQFMVADDGPGIPQDKQKLIFKEFTQIDNKNHGYKGTGLGLTIVKRILKAYNSRIELESSPGKGAQFSFVINLTPYDTSKIEEDVNDSLRLSPVTNQLETKHILIVDDNRINQKVTQKTLEKHQIKSSLADDGKMAIAMCKETNFDLILMDIHMPVMNGMEATKIIRGFNKEVPILALTAVELDENKSDILNSGIDDIIHKPYNLPVFIKMISKYLEKKEPTSLP
ncbi:tetratricopeptide repeat-containing hybrid sensor histidine kinase/response regulator [Euzebyella saccharophila]|uniref:histidine kinase n=1 Tax=Euzebyella saccharophila TaxID=679664 RepID=A0ABV8JZB1_9FLAO|nr:ATP-binding protein [Euzebyella saccharophila]